jgi:hypothetical protein
MADRELTAADLPDLTPGDRTLVVDDAEGYVVVPEGRQSVTVTCDLNPRSKVFANLCDNTDAIYIRSVVLTGRGSFTIHLSGVTSGARLCSFFIVK